MTSEFAIGIDLGTTNCVLAYTPLDSEDSGTRLLPFPQVTAPQTTEARTSLPSFLYLATQPEAEHKAFSLPWSDSSTFAVGAVARDLSAQFPDRTVAAAKSWLCHSKVDRHQALLPWNAPADVPKISPVVAAQRYLEHIVSSWNQQFPGQQLAAQKVVLTVPASFDASARELTREAAVAAGLPKDLVLLEEPQAAMYAWLNSVGDKWRKQVSLGDRILVCDIGGGTTDLTLVEVAEEEGDLQLRRIAVGSHLLVGGDNMDLALAFRVAALFAEKGVNLDPWQSISLWHSCRNAKEALLASDGPETHTISIPGRSSRLIGGLVSVEVSRKEAAELLLAGFFPSCQMTDKPVRQRTSGFQEIGLPYESDTAVTRHMAAFLQQHCADSPVTHIIFNGGVFKSEQLRSAIVNQLHSWFPKRPPHVIEGSEDLDNAVSRGACFFGWSRANGGIRIRGGTARSYYVGIETAGLAIPGAPRPLKALCVVPHGMEEGTEIDVPSGAIGLIVGEPARFRFFSSATRCADAPGNQLDRWNADEMTETDSMEATLPADPDSPDEYIPVRFQSRITELGILELWCVNDETGRQWKLEFSVRDDAESTTASSGELTEVSRSSNGL
ncbi:MAG: Hsp70 family protein [Planctomycetaceae bacterium]|nr:Hsp70 family protein [Planctomycetaceae bacterium]